MPKVYTFDVFDTCLTRLVAFPTDIFCEVAKAWKDVLEPSLGNHYIEVFRANRVQAESEALSRSDAEEVTLDCIWRHLAHAISVPDFRSGMQRELEAERRYIQPNEKLRSKIGEIRRLGARVAFISDTYLPESFVLEALAKHGFFVEGDGLYVSSSHGLTKRSGSLFKFFLERERVEPRSVMHAGDNHHSDVKIPRSLGIRVRPCADAPLGRSERSIVRKRIGTGLAESRLAGAMRCFRLKAVDPQLQPAEDFVASFLGPFLLTFCAWILKQARLDGVRRLYFLSRDCYLLWRVATKFADSFGIECRYLQVSRQSLALPSAGAYSEEGMPWLRPSYEDPTLEQLLAKLELKLCDVPTLKKFAGWQEGCHRLTEPEWNEFWRAVNEEPLRSAVSRLIEARKSAAMRYLETQGLLKGQDWAVVDLGWHLTCQASLNTLLSSISTERVRGYYLGLHAERRTPRQAGAAKALFYSEVHDRAALVAPSAIFSYITALEHLLGIAPHGTVHHYELSDGEAVPICGGLPEQEKALASAIQDLLEAFCESTGELVADLGDSDLAREVLDQLVLECLRHPKVAWVEVLSSISVSEDQNNLGARPIAAPVRWLEFAASCIPWQLRRRVIKSAVVKPWPEAALCMSSPLIRKAALVRETVRNAASPLLRKAALLRRG